MREIRFRAKRKDDGQWIYGYYMHFFDHHTIVYRDLEGNYREDEIDSSTLGQFTGFYDKRGIEIYEGDVLRIPVHKFDKIEYQIYVVVWDEKNGMWTYKGYGFYDGLSLRLASKNAEVIGTKWDVAYSL